jgi:spore maturation protein CgeB
MKTALFNCPYLSAPGAIRWIVASWGEGFKRSGYAFHTCDDARLLEFKCRELKPTILYCDIVSTPIEDEACRDLLREMRQRGTKVCINVYWPMSDQPAARVDALARYNIADLYCGEREPDSMSGFEARTGKRYVTMPQSANPRFHHPVPFNPKFAYDVAFVGAKLPQKRWFNENILGALSKRYRVGLFGPGWTLRDNTLRAISKGARIINYRPLARLCDSARFSISDEDEVSLYSSSKIALNFHEREPDNSQPHHIVNQRTFKIAACGGFQIADPVAALPKYFANDEIVTAEFDAQDWLTKVDYFLTHEAERKAIQERATARALSSHMAQNRVALLEQLLGIVPQFNRAV